MHSWPQFYPIINEDEFQLLLLRLKHANEEVTSTYKYPFTDLIEHIEKVGNSSCHAISRDDNGTVTEYFIAFSSPSDTWETLCGVAGYYKVDAETLKSKEFQCFTRG